LLFVAIFSLAAVPPLDPDLWWHLANGRLLVHTLSIPHVDVYSFSAAGQPWVMHEWLADLGMYGLFKIGGLPLLVALFAMVVTGAAVGLYCLLRAGGLAQTPSVLVTLLGALAGSTAWGARPQLLNPLLAGLLLLGLLRYRQGRLSPWLLPPFIWLWANLHSGFMVGVIISGLFAAGEAFDCWRGAPKAMDGSRIRRLAIAIALGLVLAAVNPFGIQALLFAVGTLTSSVIQNNIQEWASPDFHTLPGLLLEALVFLLLAGLATRRVKAPASEWLLAFALLYLAFSSQRHVPLFVLGAAPLLGRCVQATLAVAASLMPDRLARTPRKRSSVGRLGLPNLALLLVVGAGMVAYRAVPNLLTPNQEQAISAVEPVVAAGALGRTGKPARVFNYYDFGGYLVWTLGPSGSRVYIDGRVEVYGPRIFTDYLRVNYLGDGWQSVLQASRADAVILPNGHPLVRLLQQDSSWQQFTRDRVATVFTRVGFAP
jgi:hypothetical protein